MTIPTKVPPYNIHGFVAQGFEAVREKFIENFEKRSELGASLCVYKNGEKVIDIWGGFSDLKRQKPWEEDTMTIVFSTTKGMSSLALSLLHSQGHFSYDDAVTKYWPAFGQNGKENISIRTLLAHQAGLCALDRRLRIKTLLDIDKMSKILEEQTPAWVPGEEQGYHVWTIAFYIDQLVRRIDPKHRSLSDFFHEEIALPLNQPFYIGLPKAMDKEKVSKIIPFSKLEFFRNSDQDRKKASFEMLKPWTLKFKTFLNPRFTLNLANFNKSKIQTLPIGSACGFGNARTIASIYNEFVMGGKNLGIHANTYAELERPPVKQSSGNNDLILEIPVHFSLGMAKPSPFIDFGTNHKAYGTFGAGGSVGFCDPDKKVAYSYVMNKMGIEIANDPREVALRTTIWACLEKQEKNK